MVNRAIFLFIPSQGIGESTYEFSLSLMQAAHLTPTFHNSTNPEGEGERNHTLTSSPGQVYMYIKFVGVSFVYKII